MDRFAPLGLMNWNPKDTQDEIFTHSSFLKHLKWHYWSLKMELGYLTAMRSCMRSWGPLYDANERSSVSKWDLYLVSHIKGLPRLGYNHSIHSVSFKIICRTKQLWVHFCHPQIACILWCSSIREVWILLQRRNKLKFSFLHPLTFWTVIRSF